MPVLEHIQEHSRTFIQVLNSALGFLHGKDTLLSYNFLRKMKQILHDLEEFLGAYTYKDS